MVNSYVAHAVTSVGTAIVYFIHPFGSLVRHVPRRIDRVLVFKRFARNNVQPTLTSG